MIKKCSSPVISVFHGREAPEEGMLAGYAAIINSYNLQVPMPADISLISTKKRKYTTEGWRVFTSRHAPDETLYKQLVFALKYEGVNMLVLKKLFEVLSEKEMVELVQLEPLGRYSRRTWFLYEWLQNTTLNIPDLSKGNFVPLLDENLQYTIKGKNSPRYRIINNLPGTLDFCPLIRRTEKLDTFIASNFAAQKNAYLKGIHKDVLQRASAFLLLKDSKASFTIEGESPKSKRAARWGQAIGQAGNIPLSAEEFLRLQQLVIENERFITMGFRDQGGFVGEHDRSTGEPIPTHVSARKEDVARLIDGLISTNDLLQESEYDAVLAAAMIAFGFVFIHPYVDGNGRIHRYIIHHILARKGMTQQGIIFPVSASILDHIQDYQKVLESYSHPLLDLIEWKTTSDNNVEVLNDTIDLYRYFDATRLAEFLYDCVHDTIINIIPNEVKYLKRYDEFKRFVDDEFEMPDKMVALLVRFLEQGDGKISKRARQKEFALLEDQEISVIESYFQETFTTD